MIQGVKEKPTDERFAELCQNAGGNVSAIGRAIGVTRGTVHVWIAETPFFCSVYRRCQGSRFRFSGGPGNDAYSRYRST